MKTSSILSLTAKKATCLFLVFVCLFSCGSPRVEAQPSVVKRIKLALLLDTSNSMDGLIEQAKSQLWGIVNELALAKCGGEQPKIEIALYEYGNDGLPAREGYIRQVSAMTSDLDVISEKLFSLRTNGGNEFCGQVIQTSLNQLDWGGDADLKMIFIAGNEPFTQGSVSYRLACGNAKEKGVVVNTIFCGNFSEGVNSNWKDGASLTGGSYMSIEQNQKTVYIESPYDDRINELNNSLNDTYIPYGTKGRQKKEMQLRQDQNAGSYSKANSAKRAKSKSSAVYKNESWDLVDAEDENAEVIEELEPTALPDTMQTMNVEERKKYVESKRKEREKIQKDIQDLSKKREEYVAKEKKKQGEQAGNSLDDAMLKAIRKQATDKGFVFEE